MVTSHLGAEGDTGVRRDAQTARLLRHRPRYAKMRTGMRVNDISADLNTALKCLRRWMRISRASRAYPDTAIFREINN